MYIAEVVGNVWGTRKHKSLRDKKLLLVRPIDPFTEKPLGDAVLALDGGVQAGPGGVVLVVDEGNSARQILKDANAPVRAVICGIVDQVASGGRIKKYD
ncbi:MAG TPA: EutN/CcmL family microcompartment protein [Elusimicrobiota bacterium]|nr:EutN/CcmL family microcompartment protein [Elusimicrobiota bacterium]